MTPTTRATRARLLAGVLLGPLLGILGSALTPATSFAEKAYQDEPNCGAGTNVLCRTWRSCDIGFEADRQTCNGALTIVYWYYRN